MSEELLSASGEAAWQSLRQHIEWTPGFWIGWVFTDHTPSVHELHQRIEAQLRAVGRGAVIQQPREPGALVEVLGWLLAGADGCDGCVTIAVVRQEEAWQAAWDQFLLRLNERRELLREQLRAGLLLCAPTKFKPRSREAAPDLWSIRSLALDVAPIASSGPHLITLREHVPDNPPGSPEAVTLALQAVAAAQRAGQTDAEAKARIRAAQALFAVGRRDEGREQAVYAAEVAPSPALQTRALVVLAGLEWALGDLVAAERHYRAAIIADPVNSGPQAHGGLAELLLFRGALVEARSVAERTLALSRVRHARSGDTVEALQDEAASVQLFGDVLRAQGDWHGAVVIYEELLTLVRRNRRMSGDTADALRDEAVSLQRLGDALRAKGSWSEAGAVYEESLALFRKCRGMVGDTPETLRDEALSLVRMGEVSRAQGNWGAAGTVYEKGLWLSRQIRRMVGDTAEALGDEALSLIRMGDVLVVEGNGGGARVAYDEGLAISRRLRGMVGDTADVMQTVSVGLERLGDMLRVEEDWSRAGVAYEEALRLRRRVRGMVGDTTESLRAVAVSLERLGAVLLVQGDLSGAGAAYEEALELSRRIYGLAGDTHQVLMDLALDLQHSATTHEQQGRLAEARGELLEAVDLLQRLKTRIGESHHVTAVLAQMLEALAKVSRDESAPSRPLPAEP